MAGSTLRLLGTGDPTGPGLALRWTLGLVTLFLLAAAPAAGASAPAGGRVVAIGDVHGAYPQLVELLRAAGLVDSQKRWIGGRATLVQLGDFLDRGEDVRDVMDLFLKLQEEAPRSGGRVVVLLGNHEAMNLVGLFHKYVPPGVYERFAGPDAGERRQALFEAAAAIERGRSRRGTLPEGFEESWKRDHPPGYLEYHEALSPRGRYGRWLRSLPAAAVIGDTFYLHAGLRPGTPVRSAEEITERVHAEIAAFDRVREALLAHGQILPTASYHEVMGAARAFSPRRDVVTAAFRGDAAADARETRQAIRELRQLQRPPGAFEEVLQPAWFLTDPDGPLWFRGFARWREREGVRALRSLCRAFGVKRFVAGHSPGGERAIRRRFGGAVFLIDTGMLDTFYRAGRASALELDRGRLTAIYVDRREVLEPGPGDVFLAELEEEEAPGEAVKVTGER